MDLPDLYSCETTPKQDLEGVVKFEFGTFHSLVPFVDVVQLHCPAAIPFLHIGIESAHLLPSSAAVVIADYSYLFGCADLNSNNAIVY